MNEIIIKMSEQYQKAKKFTESLTNDTPFEEVKKAWNSQDAIARILADAVNEHLQE